MTFYDKYLKYKNKYKYLRAFSDLEYVYSDYDSSEKRKKKLNDLFKNKIRFPYKLYIIGYGAIGPLLLHLLINCLSINYKNITVIDEQNVSDKFNKYYKNKDIKLINKTKVTKDNYLTLFKDLSINDIIIDCAFDIDTLALVKLCQERGASHINSCLGKWSSSNAHSDAHSDTHSDAHSDAQNDTIYKLHNEIDNYTKTLNNINFNFVACMGCNPGNVSLWAKLGIIHIANKELFNLNTELPIKYNELANKLDIQVIHISEKDTQIINNPKKLDEYCNTWASTMIPYYYEGLAPIELSWGTHEQEQFSKDEIISYENNYLILKKKGFYTNAQSWVPLYGRFIGNIICHDEALTIGTSLTVYDVNNSVIYKPSIYYVYNPCDAAHLSIEELKDSNDTYQTNYRLLSSEVESGRDILGLTFYLANKNVYWIGSLLSIEEARYLFNEEINDLVNATNVQVVAGYLTGIMQIIKNNKKNIKSGLINPDDLDIRRSMKYQLPLLGEFMFTKVNNHNLKMNNWKFSSFLRK